MANLARFLIGITGSNTNSGGCLAADVRSVRHCVTDADYVMSVAVPALNLNWKYFEPSQNSVLLAGYSLRGNYQSMKYRKMISIIIIISLGQILLSYIANTSRTHTHARTHARMHTHPPTTVADQVVAVQWVGAPNHDEVSAPF